MIGIDIDGAVQKLVQSFFRARVMYPSALIDTYVSSRGYHLIIHQQCDPIENFVARALIGDDPKRLQYSLIDWAWDGFENVQDVLFDVKWGRSRKKFDLESMIGRKRIAQILEAWEDHSKRGNLLADLTKDIETKLKKPPRWMCCAGSADKKFLREVADHLKEQGVRCGLFPSFYPVYDWIISTGWDSEAGAKEMMKKMQDLGLEEVWIKKIG
jgi:hypothetical protein